MSQSKEFLVSASEDAQIDIIGKTIMDLPKGSQDKPQIIGVVVENMEKANRYIRKVKAKFPQVRFLSATEGKIGLVEVVVIKFGEPLR